MIPLIIIFLILCSGSIVLSLIFKKRFEETIAVNIMGIIFTIYISGIFGFLKLGVYIVIGLSCLAIIYTIYDIIKNKKIKETIQNIITPGFLVFVLFYIFFIIVHRGRLCVGWDEFSHWGDVVKAMFNINDFSTNPESMSMFKSYPPGMSIFQYFWMVIGGIFREWYLYISYQIFAIALILPVFKNVNWKQIIKIICLSLLILFIPTIIYSGYYEVIYIDAIVGIMFGYVLSNILLVKVYNKFDILKLSLSLSLLILLKDVGGFLALIAIIIMVFDVVILKKETFCFKKISKKEKKEYLKLLAKILLIILIVILVKISWNINISNNNVTKSFSKPMFTKDLFKQIIGVQDFEIYQKETLHNFFIELSNSNITSVNAIDTNYYCLLSIISLILYLIYIKQKENNSDNYFNKKLVLVNLVSIIGGIIYALGLLLLYITRFSSYEAVRLASFPRYLGIYCIGLIIYLLLTYNYMLNKISVINKKKIVAILLTIVIIYIPFFKITELILVRSKSTIVAREKYNIVESKVKFLTKNEKKNIYIISQNTTGYDFWVSKFILRPNYLSGWSVGESYGEEDIWTIYKTAKQWQKELIAGFDYVFIYKKDDQFVNQFKELFEKNEEEHIKDLTLYYVNKETGKLVLIN